MNAWIEQAVSVRFHEKKLFPTLLAPMANDEAIIKYEIEPFCQTHRQQMMKQLLSMKSNHFVKHTDRRIVASVSLWTASVP